MLDMWKVKNPTYTSLLEIDWYQAADTILIGQCYNTSVAGNLQPYNCQDSDWETHCLEVTHHPCILFFSSYAYKIKMTTV